jgi:hypothetical protein
MTDSFLIVASGYQIPPEGELVSFVDKVKEGIANIASGVKDTFGSISPLASEPEPQAGSEPESKPVAKQSAKKKSK